MQSLSTVVCDEQRKNISHLIKKSGGCKMRKYSENHKGLVIWKLLKLLEF